MWAQSWMVDILNAPSPKVLWEITELGREENRKKEKDFGP